MNREQKLSLIIGFTLILLVGVLISDHLSGARTASVSGVEGDEVGLFEAQLTSSTSAPSSFTGEEEASVVAANQDTPSEIDEPEAPTTIAQADPGIASKTEPFALIDQSKGELGLLHEIVSRGGGIFDQGREKVFELPLAKSNESVKAPTRWHTVARGESLWTISEAEYGAGRHWKRIAEANATRIGDNGQIREGTRLEIPDIDGVTAPAVAETTPGVAKPGVSKPASKPESKPARTYTVRKNDTIGEISLALLGTSRRWQEIVALNKDTIKDENVVFEGQVLKIPAK